MPSTGGLPVGGKHSAAPQNCLAYGNGRVRPKYQHLPPCRGWASVAAVASAAGLASPQLLGMGAALGKRSAAYALPWRSACRLPVGMEGPCLPLGLRISHGNLSLSHPIFTPLRNPAPALPRPNQCLCQGRAQSPGG